VIPIATILGPNHFRVGNCWVGRGLGARYVVEGSVRKAISRVRIAVQLIDATSDAHLWADRFDGSLRIVFALQDKVALGVAAVEPTLQAAEIRRSSARWPSIQA
jgi:adenylate cyclase